MKLFAIHIEYCDGIDVQIIKYKRLTFCMRIELKKSSSFSKRDRAINWSVDSIESSPVSCLFRIPNDHLPLPLFQTKIQTCHEQNFN